MKYLKTYIQLNEGLLDKMSGPSDDEISAKLSTLNPIERYYTIKNKNIDSKFLPSDEEILTYFKDATKSEKNNWLLRLVSQDDVKSVKKILELGIKLDLNHYYYDDKSRDGFTLLHIAVDNESIDMIKLLIRYGANPHIKDVNDISSLELAKTYNIDIISMILDKNVNEGIRDKMTGPSDERVEELLKDLSNNDKIVEILKRGLDYKYLPRDEKGWCTYKGNLNIRADNKLEQLPEKLIVEGNLNVPFHKISEYPKDLIVKKNLIFNYNKLTKLPANLTVNGDLEIISNNLTKLPKGLTVMGSLYCNNNNLVEIPDDIIVHGDFFASHNSITEIPANLYSSKSLDLVDNKLTNFPSKINIKGMISVVENEITELPANLYIPGSLSCSSNKLTKLPKGLVVEKSLYCNVNKITELPEDLIVKEKLYIAINPLKDIRKPKGVNEIIIK